MKSPIEPSPRTAAALAARRRHTQNALDGVERAIARLRRDKARISVAAISRHAGVSRTFLYENPQARAVVSAAITDTDQQRDTAPIDHHESTWRERALNAEDALKAAHSEIRVQRTRLGELLGQIRDLEAEWTQESIQRITSENITLKQRIHELSVDNRNVHERLQAARSNLRFQDRRIADLEARLTDPTAKT